MSDKYKYTNRLIDQKSPYLLQHAHNPVDWYPWGQEAFSTAAAQNKPIFLSIGYATCHWCHVMEKESFENEEVAKLLNHAFINIKVDREELPEVDSLYMEFAQSMMAGAAGWPLNIVITPDLKPLFATTYLPVQSSKGMLGIKELIRKIQDVWNSEDREQLLMQADKIVEVFSSSVHSKGEEMPSIEDVQQAAELLFKMADPIFGGIKGSPKFPIGYQSSFMLRLAYTNKDSRSLFLVERSLEMMHRGGIYDHLEGGFSRYSVDERWFCPHFEKMLYDNALIVFAYIEMWQITKRPFYKDVADDIFHYVLKQMTHPLGGFYSAQDADSEGKEGFFYTFVYDEIVHLLGKERAHQFCALYNVSPRGNFEGRNILHLTESIEEFCSRRNLELTAFLKEIEEDKQILRQERAKRIQPLIDNKILCSWNGLMIFSLTEAAKAFCNESYAKVALKAAQFIKDNMWNGQRLLRRFCDGEAKFNAGLDEYAFLIKATLTLFETGYGSIWLEFSLQLADVLERNFKQLDGAYFQTDGSDSSIILMKCQFSDGAEPSGNAVHTENLMRLYKITENPVWLKSAEDVMKAVRIYLEDYSPAYCYHLMNINRYFDKKAPTFVFALNDTLEYQQEISKELNQNFIPHKTVVWIDPKDERLFELLPQKRKQIPLNGKTTLYLCHEGVCLEPINDFEEIIKLIHKL